MGNKLISNNRCVKKIRFILYPKNQQNRTADTNAEKNNSIYINKLLMICLFGN